MSTTIRPELSTKNPYHISKHRYYELKHFCLQYPEWKREYERLSYISNSGVRQVTDNNWADPVGNLAVKMADLTKKMDLVEKTAECVDPVIGPYIFEAVTNGRSYVWLKTVMDIPCGKDYYYDIYHKYFKLLSRG